MKILSEPLKKSELLKSCQVVFDGEMIKAVVDVKREIMAIDAELHADLEQQLIVDGSLQYDLWGINIYPEEEEMIEFDSMINIRPAQENRSRGVENLEIQQKIIEIVEKWIK